MIILGRSNDDKGTQLENLTKAVLERIGYVNIVRSDIRAGGAELDVTGELPNPVPGHPVAAIPLICECKAHQTAQDMTDWNKFLGKIYTAEAERNGQVNGCFIALSGVNGNVSGAYNSFRKHKQNILLLSGSDIEASARELYPLCSISERDNAVRNFTDRPIRSYDVAYYDKKLYWLIQFEDDAFAVLAGEGNNLPADKEKEIGDMIAKNTPYGNQVLLMEEHEARKKTLRLQKEMIAWLATNDGKVDISFTYLCSGSRLPNETRSDELIAEFERIFDSIKVREDWVECSNNNQSFGLRSGVKNLCPDFPHLVDFMMTGIIRESDLVAFVSSAFYSRHVNDDLIDYIIRMQMGIGLDIDQKKEMLDVLRLSPTGLLACLRPIDIIVNHRGIDDQPAPEIMDKFDIPLIFDYAYEGLYRDFCHPALAAFYYNSLGTVELERQQRIILKTDKAVFYDAGVKKQRLRLIQMAEEFGGRVVQVLSPPDAPENWELQIPETDPAAQIPSD